MSALESTSTARAAGDDCEHVLHEWPVTGPWVDYTCAKCGHNWRLTWEQARRSMLVAEQQR